MEGLEMDDMLPALITSMPDDIYFKDRGSRFILVNQRIAEALGARRSFRGGREIRF